MVNSVEIRKSWQLALISGSEEETVNPESNRYSALLILDDPASVLKIISESET